MSINRYSEMKLLKFKEDIKDEKNFEKKIYYLIKNEFDTTLNDILQLEPDSFIDRIEKGTSFSLENIYTEECLSDPKLISIIQKLINIKKTEYSIIIQVLKETWNTYEKILKRRPHQESLLSNFRKHCVNTDNLARHNCGSNNSFFLIVKDNKNKINFVICESCKKVYYSSYISCFCNNCNIDYYSGILNDDENPNFLVATWESYHCPQIISEKMKCIKCRELFYLDMKNGMLTCLNKKCGFTTKPSRIIWTCSYCQKEFKSNAVPYNPLRMKVVKKAIRQTLLLKHRAHPNKTTCCKLNVFFTEFYHKKTCKGILYEGELNDNMIIVCEKCQAINFYERFIWTCPQCQKRFRDIKNDGTDDKNNNDDEHNHLNDINKNNNNGLNKKKEKSRSVCKNDYSNRYKEKYIERFRERSRDKGRDKDNNIENKEKKNKNQEEIITNMFNSIEEKKEMKNYNIKLQCQSPKRRNYYRREDNSSKVLNIKYESSQKERCFKIIIKNEGNENGTGSNKNNNISSFNDYFAKSVANANKNYKIEYKKQLSGEKDEIEKEMLKKMKKEETKQEIKYENYKESGKKRSNTGYDRISINNDHRRYYFIRPGEEESKKEKIEKEKQFDNNNNSNNIFLKTDGFPKNERNIRRHVSAKNIVVKDENQKNNINNYSNNNNIYLLSSKDLRSPEKKNKINRYSSVDYKRTSENKEEIGKRNYNISAYKKKYSNDIENYEHRKNKIRFHASINISNEENNEEKEEKEEKVEKEINKRKKFIRFRVNKINNKEKKDFESMDINVEEDDERENKNVKDNSDIKTKGKEENKNYMRYNSDKKNIRNFIAELEVNDITNKNNDSNVINKEKKENKENKDNKDAICPCVPDNIGLENLVGLADNLLIHSKRRINNLYAKLKIPIFNIEDYKIIRKLGEGSYGIIYSVNKNNQKNPEYALKKIVARTITEICNFFKEFELVYSCQHPNIMKIYGVCLRILDSTTFTIYVLMEKSKYDWDKEIKSRLSKRKMYSEKELINILKQLVEALLFLKNKYNISHRDIKPQNILVFDNGVYKLADFGEAKEIKISKKLNTLRGTELYMSPALYEGLKKEKNDVSHDTFKSDVFSLGFCVLFSAGLNFNLLYQVRDMTDNNVTEKAINSYLNKTYSAKFIQILCKMLKIDEIQRFGFAEILEYINNNYKNEM